MDVVLTKTKQARVLPGLDIFRNDDASVISKMKRFEAPVVSPAPAVVLQEPFKVQTKLSSLMRDSEGI